MKYHDESFLKVDFKMLGSKPPPQLNDDAFEQTKETMKVAKSKRKRIEIYDCATKNFRISSEGAKLYSQTEALLRTKIKTLCNGTVGYYQGLGAKLNLLLSADLLLSDKSVLSFPNSAHF